MTHLELVLEMSLEGEKGGWKPIIYFSVFIALEFPTTEINRRVTVYSDEHT